MGEVRVCVCGCGRELRDKDEQPDFKRIFFSKECRDRDKARKIALKRAKHTKTVTATNRCPTCKHKGGRRWLTIRGVRIGLLSMDSAVALLKTLAAQPAAPVHLPAKTKDLGKLEVISRDRKTKAVQRVRIGGRR